MTGISLDSGPSTMGSPVDVMLMISTFGAENGATSLNNDVFDAWIGSAVID